MNVTNSVGEGDITMKYFVFVSVIGFHTVKKRDFCVLVLRLLIIYDRGGVFFMAIMFNAWENLLNYEIYLSCHVKDFRCKIVMTV